MNDETPTPEQEAELLKWECDTGERAKAVIMRLLGARNAAETGVASLKAEVERLRAEQQQAIEENHAIFTLTGPPRKGFSLQQEIRAQLEEAQGDVVDLKAEVERLTGQLDLERACHDCGEYRLRAEQQLREARELLRLALKDGLPTWLAGRVAAHLSRASQIKPEER